jgi:hypothetical protein
VDVSSNSCNIDNNRVEKKKTTKNTEDHIEKRITKRKMRGGYHEECKIILNNCEEKNTHTIRTDFGFNLLHSASKLKRGVIDGLFRFS